MYFMILAWISNQEKLVIKEYYLGAIDGLRIGTVGGRKEFYQY